MNNKPKTPPLYHPGGKAVEEIILSLALVLLSEQGEARSAPAFDDYDRNRLQILLGFMESLRLNWATRLRAGIHTSFPCSASGMQAFLDALRQAHATGSTLLVKAGLAPRGATMRVHAPVVALRPDGVTLDSLLDTYNLCITQNNQEPANLGRTADPRSAKQVTHELSGKQP